MFNDIGGKIKVVAQVSCWVGIIISVIYGLIMMFTPYMFLAGLLILVLGSLTSWLTSLSLYALGEIVDELKQSNRNTYEIYHLLKKESSVADTQSKSQAEFPAPAAMHSHSEWVCPNCGKKNDSLAQFCKICGKHK